MGEIVEIFARAIAVVGLERCQRPAWDKLRFELTQRFGQFWLGQMFEQVAGKRVIDGAVFDPRQVGDGADDGLHARCQMRWHLVPDIDPDAAPRDDIIDELAIAAAQVEHAIITADAVGEKIVPQRLPDHVALGVLYKAGFVISWVTHAKRFCQPNTSPAIIRAPTVKPRQLLTLPPFDSPTRG